MGKHVKSSQNQVLEIPTVTEEDSQPNQVRRKLAGSTLLASLSPINAARWTTPIIASVTLPVHAQTSQEGPDDPDSQVTTTSPPSTTTLAPTTTTVAPTDVRLTGGCRPVEVRAQNGNTTTYLTLGSIESDIRGLDLSGITVEIVYGATNDYVTDINSTGFRNAVTVTTDVSGSFFHEVTLISDSAGRVCTLVGHEITVRDFSAVAVNNPNIGSLLGPFIICTTSSVCN